ncbi:MAG: fructosamine kinase family protein [Puniceicoccaceae bacterium]
MDSLEQLLESVVGRGARVIAEEPVGGGCIHEARRIRTGAGDFFVKSAPESARPLLEAEADGLEAIRKTRTVKVPATIALGPAGGRFHLVLEWLDLRPLDARSGARLGEELAALHRAGAGSAGYGWERDNFIGRTPQPNGPMADWVAFFRERRLRHQLRLAGANGHSLPDPAPLLEGMGVFFEGGPAVPAAPLHGDLWGGNAAADGEGRPVLFDPAFYRGDPETDLAFSRFFGGFPAEFHRAYAAAIPPRPGWKIRQTLYNLYHVLNHLNLFGAGYRAEACRMIADLNHRATATR